MKSLFKKVALSVTLLTASITVNAQTDTIYVYGPGGPLSAMKACATQFTATTKIPVKVIGGPESKWLSSAEKNANIIYGGAEYMLTQFTQNYPDMVNKASRTALYQRRVAILVRPGNPKKITSLKDLTREGIKILDVNGAGQLGLWEDIAGKENLIGSIQKNIVQSFTNTALGIEAWKADSGFDAWITYASWHKNLKDITTVVELPVSLRLYRGTPIVLTKNKKNTVNAQKFVAFLKSTAGHRIFQQWGWE
ncbi:substrate-binding domain-containing protein [Pedobacter sp. PLR]|uniref:substrate-binding domain-containing protein n=1 Tax=Pedobacter sp. PLR TaxID=2994465 RepID=UPI0022477826|nr:substrate-binding domain-containing protein [Pedobacter sp. PLR]MCX2452059.1 substrate-binding domain-containing protein [Pedobacter sp. PLR]